MRKGFKRYSNHNKLPMIFGTMIHEIFQKTLDTHCDSKIFIDRVVTEVINKNCLDLYDQIGKDEDSSK